MAALAIVAGGWAAEAVLDDPVLLWAALTVALGRWIILA